MATEARNRIRMRPEARREQLLDAAVWVFGSRPYDEVTMAAIAERAGVSKGLVFNYFRGKRELYREVLRVAAGRAELASDPDPALPAPQRFRVGLEVFVTAVAGAPHLLRAYGAGADPEARALIAAVYESIAARMIDRMGVAATPRLRHAVLAWLEFVRTTTVAWIAERAVTREQLIELQIATFRAAAETALGPDAKRAALP
jgi:AcrR family transcriptional regulator